MLDKFAYCSAFSEEIVIFWIRGEVAFELFSKSADLIVGEFVRLFASEAFEIVFHKQWIAGACEECSEVNGSLIALSRRRL